MANKEFYSSDEFKSAPEYKRFEAEVYKKPNEFKNTAPEFADNGPESKFTTPPSEETEKAKKPENKRLRAVKSFRQFSETATKVLGTATGTIAAAATVVIVCSTIFAPSPTAKMHSFEVGANYVIYSLELSDLDEDIDYDIVISNPYDSFVHKDVHVGLNENYVVGLRAFQSYTLSLVGKGDGASGTVTYYEKTFYTDPDKAWVDEHYDAWFEASTLDETSVIWGETEHELVLPVFFEAEWDSGFGYHAILLNERNEEVARYEGVESSPVFVVDADVGKLSVRYEKVRLLEGTDFVYETYLSDGEIDLTPTTVELSQTVELIAHNSYRIPYRVNGSLGENPDYYFVPYVNGQETGDDVWELFTDKENSAYVYLTEYPEEFSFYLELCYYAPYGNQFRTVRSNELVYRPETQLIVDGYVTHVNSSMLIFDFGYHAPSGSYVSIVDEETGEETKFYGGTFELPVQRNERYSFTYALTDENGKLLTERQRLDVDTSVALGGYQISPRNPGELLVTKNPDGTCNLFIDLNFSSDDANVYYEITVVASATPYVYRSKENFAVIKNLPEDLYSVRYDVYYDTGDGQKHMIYNYFPSGTTEHLPWDHSFTQEDSTLNVTISEKILFRDELTVRFDNGKTHNFRKEDMQLIDGEYVYSLELPEGAYNAVLIYYGNKAKEAYELHAEQLGKENIQGDPYFKIEVKLTTGG